MVPQSEAPLLSSRKDGTRDPAWPNGAIARGEGRGCGVAGLRTLFPGAPTPGGLEGECGKLGGRTLKQ